MKKYAAKVVSQLAKFPSLADQVETFDGVDLLNIDHFANGEMEVTVDSSIRGKDAFVFTSSARNDADIGVDESKIELYHAIDVLKRSQAAKITVFEPFMSCSRSDRTTRRNSVGLWIHIKTLVSLGTNHIVTYQLHSDKSQSMVDPALCSFDNIPAHTLLERYLCDVSIRSPEKLEKEVSPNWAFCSVDAGGEKLARIFANAFNSPLVIAHKQRDQSRLNTVESINILSAEPVTDKTLWIVDDMIDTAGSVQSLIHALANLCPKEINIIAVHALFSPPAVERIQTFLSQGLIKRIIVTDTVNCPVTMAEQIPNLEIVPSTGLSARVINTIATNSSMNKLMRPFDAGIYLKSPNLFNQ